MKQSHNIARCKPVVALSEELSPPDDSGCASTSEPQAITDGVRPNGFAWSDVGGESTNQPTDFRNQVGECGLESELALFNITSPKNQHRFGKLTLFHFSNIGWCVPERWRPFCCG